MPAGVSWPRYLTFAAAAFASMITGSQIVHLHYRPLVDLHKYIYKELENFPEDIQEKIKNELREEGILK
ncbi:protein brawnin [Aricia agestis]|uniref:protein brawnin n=1 Tax=Aricia agestis TaxID=91739 RepID=UPI001C20B6AB|nr:protein brawnin [Aricia agestis]